MKCKICNETIFGHGHNAQPIANGRCCDVCNDTQVVPTRLNNMLEQSPAYQMFARIMQDMERVNEERFYRNEMSFPRKCEKV